MVTFADRGEAGRQLANRLRHLSGEPVVVLGLPRGGVPVGFEVAKALGAPLDVIMVRKLGVPSQPELAMGAIGEGGVRIVNHEALRLMGVTNQALAAVEQHQRVVLDSRLRQFRGDRPRTPLTGRVAVIVDDGLATGSTAQAACVVARRQGARRVVLAVPVAPPGWTDRLGDAADEYVCVATPEPFFSIGQFYANFLPTSDAEVVACLELQSSNVASSEVVGGRGSGSSDLAAHTTERGSRPER